jgi:trehalose 6-phosphate phosphatase
MSMSPPARLDTGEVLARLSRTPQHTGLFVDYDGTLATIVDDPAAAHPLPGASRALERLAERLGIVAVVSGRPAAFLLDELRLPPNSAVRIAGHYGIERARANGEIVLPDGAARLEAELARLGRELRHELPDGAELEQKRFGLTLHWRRVPAAQSSALALARDVANRAALELRPGKLSAELVAPLGIDKATTVRDLAAGLDVAGVLGDDLGDLGAFTALGELGAISGLDAVRIAVDGTEAPLALLEAADLVLPGPEAAVDLLERLASLVA